MTQKEKALECLKALKIYEPYIEAFENQGTVTLFENFGGFYIAKENEPDLFEKIKAFEEEYGSLVYAVTHEFTEFGECYDFLCVSKYEEDWERSVDVTPDFSYVWTYVWNKTIDWCSEYGTICVKSHAGGIKRIA